MKIKLLPLLPLILGIIFTLILVIQIPEGAYFSGDAGLKALLSKQLAREIRFDLIPPSQPWVRELWQQGLYAYTPPYAYYLGDRYYIAFPYTFPLITAPFYRLFGYYGLYIVPLVSTWIVWGLFYWTCRLLKFSPIWTTLSLVILIFASPLTPYSVLYWEHSLAVCLAFAAVPLMLVVKKNFLSQSASILLTLLAGMGLGFSVWFRQDLFCLVALLFAIAFFQILLQWQPIRSWLASKSWKINFSLIPRPWLFCISTAIATGLYFVFNKPVYGSFFGIPRVEMLEVTLIQKLLNAVVGFEAMGVAFIVFMPIAAFIAFYITASIVDRPHLKPNFLSIAIYALSLILLWGIAFLVPAGTSGLIPGGKQWGVRFLLILVPIFTLVNVEALKSICDRARSWLKYTGIVLFTILSLVSFHKNTLEGSAFVLKSYRDIEPAIGFLNAKTEPVIAISHQFVAQALEASVSDEKLWFKVENTEDLTLLGQRLVAENIDRFVYVCYPFAPCPLPETASERLVDSDRSKTYRVDFKPLGQKGKYPIYEVTIDSSSS